MRTVHEQEIGESGDESTEIRVRGIGKKALFSAPPILGVLTTKPRRG
jgi:hypothetical protein